MVRKDVVVEEKIISPSSLTSGLTLNIISGIDGVLLVVYLSKTLPQRQESGSYETTRNDLGVHNTASVANRAQRRSSISVAHEYAPLLGVAHHIGCLLVNDFKAKVSTRDTSNGSYGIQSAKEHSLWRSWTSKLV